MKQLVMCFVLLAGCAGGSKPTLKSAVAAAVVSTNAAYGLAVEACDAKEKAIVAREVSTIEKDKADIAAVRAICDNIYSTFDQARNLVPLVQKLEGI